MTCYFRHLKGIFEKIGVIITKENKKTIDEIIHAIVGIDYKNCSLTWKVVKKRIKENEESFIKNLKNELEKVEGLLLNEKK